MENHAKERIKHKIVLPNSKTINIEGTNFKYEIHYDQLNDEDLLTIEKYANYIFHAYHEKRGLDINTDRTFKGFIYNNLTDLRNAHLGYNVAHAWADSHHYPHKSGSIIDDLTVAICYTLNLYNKENYGIPILKGTLIRDIIKELKAIKLDDNQEESNTAEKPETTINQKEQEESKKIELSSSGEEEKSKLDEKKSGREEISSETMLPDLNNSNNNQKESNTAEKPETTINQKEQEESKKIELSGSGEEKIKVEEEKSSQEEISPETVLPDLNNSNNNQEESSTEEKPETTINQEKQEESKKVESSGSEKEKIKLDEKKSSQEEISPETVLPNLNNSDNNQEESSTEEKPETTINQEKQEESKKVESSGSEKEKIKLDEKKSSQEEISPEKHEVVLPNSKTINIEGTNFKYEIHYDQLDEKDLLTIEKYANHIFRAYQEKYYLDVNADYTFKGFTYNNLADLRHGACANAYGHHYHYKSESIAHDLTAIIGLTLTLYNKKNYCIPYPEDAYTFIRDVQKELEEKSCQEEISPETMLPHSKIINIEGTNFKLKVHYDQLDDKDLLTIEARANSIFRAYQERNGLDMNKDYTFDTNVYDNYLSDGGSYLQEVLDNQIYCSLAKAGYDMY